VGSFLCGTGPGERLLLRGHLSIRRDRYTNFTAVYNKFP
jgi:hypothetical protein